MFFREKDSNDIAFIVHTGDMVNDGGKEKEWKKYFINIVQPIAKTIPYFPVIGNHDYDMEGGGNFAKLFGMYYTDHNFRYAFVYGNSVFIILDANLITYQEEFHIPKDRAERQYHWLEKILKSASSNAKIKHKFIFFHEAPFVSAQNYHLDDAEKLRTYKIGGNFFLDIFRKYNVDAVFVGHVHYYERWVERYKKGSKKRQITWVITGGGGAKNALIEWHGLKLGKRPPRVLTKKEKNERIRSYNLRAKRDKNITNWSFSQSYPTKRAESLKAIEKHYCIVHVNGNFVWMEVKNKNQKLIEAAIIKKSRETKGQQKSGSVSDLLIYTFISNCLSRCLSCR